MSSEIPEIPEEASVHGTTSSSHGLRAPWQQSVPEGPGVPLKCGSCSVCGHTRTKVMLLLFPQPHTFLGHFFILGTSPGKKKADLFPQSNSLFMIIFCGWTTCLFNSSFTHPSKTFSPTPFPSTSFSWLTFISKLYLRDEIDQSLSSTIPQIWVFKIALRF